MNPTQAHSMRDAMGIGGGRDMDAPRRIGAMPVQGSSFASLPHPPRQRNRDFGELPAPRFQRHRETNNPLGRGRESCSI